MSSWLSGAYAFRFVLVSQAWSEFSLEQEEQQPRGVTGFEISSLGFVLGWWELGFGTSNLCVITDMLIVSKGFSLVNCSSWELEGPHSDDPTFTTVPIFIASIDAVRSFVCGLGQGCCFLN